MKLYSVQKMIEANSLEEAILLEKKTPINSIILEGETEDIIPSPIGFSL
jgi:hypothetical protein